MKAVFVTDKQLWLCLQYGAQMPAWHFKAMCVTTLPCAGRFGVGFSSCYHLTDLPTFVSGKYLVLFDPHCQYLPNVSPSNPGKRIDFPSARLVEQNADLAAPYKLFGCDMANEYQVSCPATSISPRKITIKMLAPPRPFPRALEFWEK